MKPEVKYVYDIVMGLEEYVDKRHRKLYTYYLKDDKVLFRYTHKGGWLWFDKEIFHTLYRSYNCQFGYISKLVEYIFLNKFKHDVLKAYSSNNDINRFKRFLIKK